MKNNKQFKVGDKIVRFGKIYRIFKISRRKNFEGNKTKTIFFRPYFKSKKQEKGLTFSIPIKNLDKTNIRKPLSKKKLKEILDKISEKSKSKININTSKAKEILKKNNPIKATQILKALWKEKNDKSKSLTKTQNDIYNLSMRHLSEEIRFVFDVSLATARKKIKKSLEKGAK